MLADIGTCLQMIHPFPRPSVVSHEAKFVHLSLHLLSHGDGGAGSHKAHMTLR